MKSLLLVILISLSPFSFANSSEIYSEQQALELFDAYMEQYCSDAYLADQYECHVDYSIRLTVINLNWTLVFKPDSYSYQFFTLGEFGEIRESFLTED